MLHLSENWDMIQALRAFRRASYMQNKFRQDVFEFLGLGGLGWARTDVKCKKNEIGMNFRPWDPNGHKFVISASSSSRLTTND